MRKQQTENKLVKGERRNIIMKSFQLTVLAPTILLAFALILGMPSDGWAPVGEPPGENEPEKIVDSKVDGWIEFDGSTDVTTFFSGKCKVRSGDDDDTVSRPLPMVVIAELAGGIGSTTELTPATFLFLRFDDPGPIDFPQCFTGTDGELIITKIKKFFNNGTKIVMRVIIRRVVPTT